MLAKKNLVFVRFRSFLMGRCKFKLSAAAAAAAAAVAECVRLGGCGKNLDVFDVSDVSDVFGCLGTFLGRSRTFSTILDRF